MHPDKQAKLAQNVIALEYKYINIIEALQHIAPGLLHSDARFLHLVAAYQTTITQTETILLELAAHEVAAD